MNMIYKMFVFDRIIWVVTSCPRLETRKRVPLSETSISLLREHNKQNLYVLSSCILILIFCFFLDNGLVVHLFVTFFLKLNFVEAYIYISFNTCQQCAKLITISKCIQLSKNISKCKFLNMNLQNKNIDIFLIKLIWKYLIIIIYLFFLISMLKNLDPHDTFHPSCRERQFLAD